MKFILKMCDILSISSNVEAVSSRNARKHFDDDSKGKKRVRTSILGVLDPKTQGMDTQKQETLEGNIIIHLIHSNI